MNLGEHFTGRLFFVRRYVNSQVHARHLTSPSRVRHAASSAASAQRGFSSGQATAPGGGASDSATQTAGRETVAVYGPGQDALSAADGCDGGKPDAGGVGGSDRRL